MQPRSAAAIAKLGSALRGTILHGGCVFGNLSKRYFAIGSVDPVSYAHISGVAMTPLVGTAEAEPTLARALARALWTLAQSRSPVNPPSASYACKSTAQCTKHHKHGGADTQLHLKEQYCWWHQEPQAVQQFCCAALP
jgi:hypothetical protein